MQKTSQWHVNIYEVVKIYVRDTFHFFPVPKQATYWSRGGFQLLVAVAGTEFSPGPISRHTNLF